LRSTKPRTKPTPSFDPVEKYDRTKPKPGFDPVEKYDTEVKCNECGLPQEVSLSLKAMDKTEKAKKAVVTAKAVETPAAGSGAGSAAAGSAPVPPPAPAAPVRGY